MPVTITVKWMIQLPLFPKVLPKTLKHIQMLPCNINLAFDRHLSSFHRGSSLISFEAKLAKNLFTTISKLTSGKP